MGVSRTWVFDSKISKGPVSCETGLEADDLRRQPDFVVLVELLTYPQASSAHRPLLADDASACAALNSF